MAATCDARHVVNRAHVPTLIFGPGDIRRVHGRDEYVEVDQILDAAAVLARYALRDDE